MAEKPQATPWGELIRLARDAHVPKMSVPAAAKLTHDSVSKETWGHIERGYQRHRGGYRAAPGTPGTIAHMARVVGITPDRLAAAGRPDAAEILTEMLREDGVTQGGRVNAAEMYLADTPGLTDAEKNALISLARAMRNNSGRANGHEQTGS